jgi:TolA-binding protein
MGKDSLGGEARMAAADMYRRGDQYDTAIESYRGVATDFPGTEMGSWAQYYVARSYLSLEDTAKSVEEFQVVVDEYADFEAAEYAQGRIDKLTGVEEEATE